jgi:hypothetical protein
MRKTIKKVMIVVPVLMTSCQVSLNPNIGPMTAQTKIIETAMINVTGLPVILAVDFANRENHDLDFVGLIGSSSRYNQIVTFIPHALAKAIFNR